MERKNDFFALAEDARVCENCKCFFVWLVGTVNTQLRTTLAHFTVHRAFATVLKAKQSNAAIAEPALKRTTCRKKNTLAKLGANKLYLWRILMAFEFLGSICYEFNRLVTATQPNFLGPKAKAKVRNFNKHNSKEWRTDMSHRPRPSRRQRNKNKTHVESSPRLKMFFF